MNKNKKLHFQLDIASPACQDFMEQLQEVCSSKCDSMLIFLYHLSKLYVGVPRDITSMNPADELLENPSIHVQDSRRVFPVVTVLNTVLALHLGVEVSLKKHSIYFEVSPGEYFSTIKELADILHAEYTILSK